MAHLEVKRWKFMKRLETKSGPCPRLQSSIMKNDLLVLAAVLAGCLVGPPVCQAADDKANQFPPQLFEFSVAKEQQVRTMASDLDVPITSEIRDFFAAARIGDYTVLSNIVAKLAPEYEASYRSPKEKLPAWIPFWPPMTEVESAYESFARGGRRFPMDFGQGIIQSIPAGSIYFGGTDSGRMVVTALCESHAQGKPFYTLTQNALSDGRYEDYLRAMYGKEIYIPTTNDTQRAMEEYKADAGLRYRQGRLKPGEDVRVVDGQVQFNGAVSVMAIHELIVKVILEHNPKRRFFLEESYPMETIYPYLSPHGLIFELHHTALTNLTAEALDADHQFWTREGGRLVGGWLKPDMSVSNVCAFADTVYGRKDLSSLNADNEYVTNRFAMGAFSKLRVAIAGLYAWRSANESSSADQGRLKAEADFAFRQAFALCPTNPEVVFRYVDFLLAQSRNDDALVLVGTAQKLAPEDERYSRLLLRLRSMRP